MLKTLWHIGVWVLVALAGYGSYVAYQNQSTDYPQKPISVIIPYAAGGGTDTFVRVINKAIRDENMMTQPIVVVNKPGGSTTIGSSYVKYAKPDGYTVLCLHEALMTTKATGQSPHGPESFESIAATGEEGQMILVHENSPYNNLKELVEAARKNPDTIRFGADQNSPPHFSGLMLEEASVDAKFRYVSTGGAAKRLSALLGGHIDTAIFMTSEYIRYKSMGLKALAYLGEERHPSKEIGPIATGAEQGFPVVNNNLQYWWFPKGTSQDKIEYFRNILRRAMKTDYVRGKLEALMTIPRVIDGDALDQRIEKKMAGFEKMTTTQAMVLPNVGAWAVGLTIIFGALALLRSFFFKASEDEEVLEDHSEVKNRNDYAIGIVVLMVLYTFVLSMEWIDFRIITAMFVFCSGFFLTGFDRKKILYTLEISMVMSLGVFYVFSEIFKISLP